MTLTTASVIERLRAGERLHMQFTGGRSVWWFEQPHQVIPARTVAAVLAAPGSPLREAGDSLFGLPMNSQTWLGEGAVE